jgi:hypothetical protein
MRDGTVTVAGRNIAGYEDIIVRLSVDQKVI